MRRRVIYGLVGLLLSLCPLCMRADITHNINSKFEAGTLVKVDATVRSTNDAIVYTLGSNTELFKDVVYKSTVCFNLLKSGASITTSPALNKVNGLTISHLSDKADNVLSTSQVVVEVSLDGSDWSSVTPTVSYSAGLITVEAPENNYYVRIRSVSGTKVSIQMIVYEIGECACFPYVP